MIGAPWPRDRMEFHVKQRIRERVNADIQLAMDKMGEVGGFLREDGEHAVWRVIQQALAEAGWVIEPLDAGPTIGELWDAFV